MLIAYMSITSDKHRKSLKLNLFYYFQMWRGAIARLRYKKMLAALKIIHFYRQQKLRQYVEKVHLAFRYVIFFYYLFFNLMWHFYLLVLLFVSFCSYFNKTIVLIYFRNICMCVYIHIICYLFNPYHSYSHCF